MSNYVYVNLAQFRHDNEARFHFSHLLLSEKVRVEPELESGLTIHHYGFIKVSSTLQMTCRDGHSSRLYPLNKTEECPIFALINVLHTQKQTVLRIRLLPLSHPTESKYQ